jgi:hypothetical protein
MTPLKRAAGWCSAALFVAIGFLFANALSLTTNVSDWADLWERHSVAAAATGTALNVADPTLWPRWLMMFGFALITTAAWTAFDSAWLAASEGEQYRRWAQQFATRLAAAGAIWSTVAGSWYVFGTWREEVREVMLASPADPATLLTLVTGAAPWLPALLLWMTRKRAITRPRALAVLAAQVGVLAINAVSRQIVQNIELGRLFQGGVSAQPVETDFGPLAMFLAAFVVGVGVLAWMFAQLPKAGRQTSA